MTLERLTFIDGCRLLEPDLRDSVGYEAALIDRHVQLVHGTWGVVRGLTVALAADARSVTVARGFGYPRHGDLIALLAPAVLAAPPGTGAAMFELVLTHVRGPEGRHEAPQPGLAWVAAGRRIGRGDVPLASFQRTAWGGLVGPDYAGRANARGPRRPYVASGTLSPGAIAWGPGGAFALEAFIDTSEAGFSTTPVYFVTLIPSPWAPPTDTGCWLSTLGETALGFSVMQVFAGPAPASIAGVAWIGLESTVGCSASYFASAWGGL
jgi:hypothetical protein